MKLNPHLSFGGECEAAFKFYAGCLGGDLQTLVTWGESPMADQAPPAWGSKILHATLTVGAAVLTGADVLPGQYEKPRGVSILLGLDDPVDAERVFGTLSDNGTIQLPIQETFWAARFGVLVDQFGIPWEINCEQAPAA